MAGFNDVAIIAGCRTPTGKFQGSLSELISARPGPIAVREVVKRANLQSHPTDECIIGNIVQRDSVGIQIDRSRGSVDGSGSGCHDD